MKGFESENSTRTFSKTLTETLPPKNPKTLKVYPQTWYVNEENFSNSGVL